MEGEVLFERDEITELKEKRHLRTAPHKGVRGQCSFRTFPPPPGSQRWGRTFWQRALTLRCPSRREKNSPINNFHWKEDKGGKVSLPNGFEPLKITNPKPTDQSKEYCNENLGEHITKLLATEKGEHTKTPKTKHEKSHPTRGELEPLGKKINQIASCSPPILDFPVLCLGSVSGKHLKPPSPERLASPVSKGIDKENAGN